jgi:hypothetical protein
MCQVGSQRGDDCSFPFRPPPPNTACEFSGTALSRASLPIRGEIQRGFGAQHFVYHSSCFSEAPASLRPVPGFPRLPGGSSLPRLLWMLRCHRGHPPQAIPDSVEIIRTSASHRCPVRPLKSHSAPTRQLEVLHASTTHETLPDAVTSVLFRQMSVFILGNGGASSLALTVVRKSCRAHPTTLSFAPALATCCCPVGLSASWKPLTISISSQIERLFQGDMISRKLAHALSRLCWNFLGTVTGE